MSVLHIDEKNLVLYVSLNRPEAHNALHPELIENLTKAFKKIDESLRAVVLSGEGPSFCAGGDLRWMKESLKFTQAQNQKDAQKLSNMYEAIFQCPVPVLAFVHGSVMGGGVGLTAVCDIVAADTETKFCLSEVKLGLVPSVISPYVLRKIPESWARPLMLTAETFMAEKAQMVQLVHFVGSREDCQIYLAQQLNTISQNGPQATRKTKALIQKVKTSTWPAARLETVKTIARQRVSAEGQEGMTAFFEKRPPNWRNS